VEDHSNAHAILVVEEDDMRGGRTALVRAGLGQREKEEMGRRRGEERWAWRGGLLRVDRVQGG
jgi:hypothetical protein